MLEFSQVKVGEELPTISRVITQEKINAYAVVSGDFNPLHVNPAFAEKTIFKSTIAHGMMVMTYVAQMMQKWCNKMWLKNSSLDVKFLGPAKVGDALTVKGIVKGKNDDGTVYCEIFVENQEGKRIILGESSIKYNVS